MNMALREAIQVYLEQEDRFIPKTLAKIEKATSVNREHLLYGFLAIITLYLIFGDQAAFVCNAIGVVYPIWASVKSLQQTKTNSITQWLCYWIIFGAYCLFDETVGSWPLYWLIKCLALLTLYLPTTKGAERVYNNLFAPLFSRFVTPDEDYVVKEQTILEQTTVDNQRNGCTPPAEPDGKKSE